MHGPIFTSKTAMQTKKRAESHSVAWTKLTLDPSVPHCLCRVAGFVGWNACAGRVGNEAARGVAHRHFHCLFECTTEPAMRMVMVEIRQKYDKIPSRSKKVQIALSLGEDWAVSSTSSTMKNQSALNIKTLIPKRLCKYTELNWSPTHLDFWRLAWLMFTISS